MRREFMMMRYLLFAWLGLVGMAWADQFEITPENKDALMARIVAAQQYGFTIDQTIGIVDNGTALILTVKDGGTTIDTFFERRPKADVLARYDQRILNAQADLASLQAERDRIAALP